jgi:hypothetical protein
MIEASRLQPRLLAKAVTIVAQSVQFTIGPSPPPPRRKSTKRVQRKTLS